MEKEIISQCNQMMKEDRVRVLKFLVDKLINVSYASDGARANLDTLNKMQLSALGNLVREITEENEKFIL